MAMPLAYPPVELGKVVTAVPLVPNDVSRVPLARERLTAQVAPLVCDPATARILPSAWTFTPGKFAELLSTSGTLRYPPFPKVASSPAEIGLGAQAVVVTVRVG